MMSLALPPRLGQQLLRPRYCSSWRSRPARVHRAICVSATSCLVVAGAAASSLRQHARYWRWAQYPRRRQRSGLSRQPNSVVRSAAAAAFRVPSGDYEAMNELLDEHGVAILSNVVSPMEVESVKTLIWDWLIEQGVNRLEPSTWSMTAGGWPQDNDNTGIVCRGGAGQSLASWTVRSLPAVQAAFAAIWNTDDLLSSMDGLIIWRPWQSKPAGVLEEWKTRGSWLHADSSACLAATGRKACRSSSRGMAAIGCASVATSSPSPRMTPSSSRPWRYQCSLATLSCSTPGSCMAVSRRRASKAPLISEGAGRLPSLTSSEWPSQCAWWLGRRWKMLKLCTHGGWTLSPVA
eukprot:TRINITY_DN52927_c0_g1_i3.p1 TRINITY_DN52927_c0_g1~~TRINITY_DN52927_c0_g1_i3.p1  ORF type:complete len:349 (-),score=50.15 TRINITY_DN52927_c0_g1_i3:709-1755(-)